MTLLGLLHHFYRKEEEFFRVFESRKCSLMLRFAMMSSIAGISRYETWSWLRPCMFKSVDFGQFLSNLLMLVKFLHIVLELTDATLSLKVTSLLKNKLNLDEAEERFWRDRNVGLGYIAIDTQQFKTLVANRMQQIRDKITSTVVHST